MRSWFFRIFFLIAVLVIVFLDLAFFIIPAAAQWDFRALPANIPLINIVFLNVAQAVIAIFLASDFLKRDKKMDTAEVVYTRSISNNEYVIGKTWGTLSVFLGMTMVFLVITLVFNLIIPDTDINFLAYLVYPLLISLPTLIFILGFSYVLMLLIKNQSVTFLILVGYVAITLFYLGDKFYGIFDYMAFFTPMTYSEITGFSDLPSLLAHRLFYFFLGMAFIAATINRFSRLPNRVYSRYFYLLIFFIFFGLSAMSGGWYWLQSDKVHTDRAEYLALNNKYAEGSMINVLENTINLEHNGTSIKVDALLKGLPDDEYNDTLIFSLNPGFKLTGLTNGSDEPVDYKREKQIILVFPEPSAVKKDTLSFKFFYSGQVKDKFCYLDISEEEFKKNRNIGPLKIDKKFSFIDNDFVMLTPENFWYPVPGVGFNSKTLKNKPSYFSDYRLSVKTKKVLKPVSQGEMSFAEGIYSFKPYHKSKGLALVIGRFDSVGVSVDSVEYDLFYKPGNDFFSYHLPDIKDTVAYIIKTEKSRYDNANFISQFPYNTIRFVEVPAHFHFYQHLLDNTFETTQAEMFLYPERGIGMRMADFRRYKSFGNFRNRGQSLRPKDAQVNVFRSFIGTTFFSNSGLNLNNNNRRFNNSPISVSGIDYTLNPYSFFPYYYNLVTGINSKDFPLTETIFANYLRESDVFNFRDAMQGGMGEEEEANLLLQQRSLADIIADPTKKNIIPQVIMQKGTFLLDGLKYSAGIYNFDDFLHDYLLENQFKAFTVDSLKVRFQKEFEVDISPFLAQVGNSGDIPAFEFGQTLMIETRDEYGPVYLIKFKVTNISDVDGIIDVSFQMGGGGGFGGGASENEERIYLFKSDETKEIQIMLFDLPRMMTISTILSQNIPASYNEFMRSPEQNFNIVPEEYVRTIDDEVSYYTDNEFVVDNEDPGFSMVQENTETKIKQYFDKLKNEEEPKYASINSWWAPHYWRSVAHTAFNGSVVKSAYYTRDGSGERVASWEKELPEEGMYDVFVYIPRDAMTGRGGRGGRGGGGRGGGDRGNGPPFADAGREYQYFIYTGEDVEEVEYELDWNMDNGWNRIGAFYFPKGKAKIELTNKTDARRVFADAVKWVKRN